MSFRTTRRRSLGSLATGALAGASILAVAAAPALAKPHTAGPPAPTSAHAARAHGPQLAVSRVSSPPAGAKAGHRYTLHGTVTNGGPAAGRTRVTVRLVRRGSHPRTIGTASAVTVGAHRTRKYTAAVTLPKGLARGSYLVLACAKRAGGSGPLGCATATRKVTVGPAAAVRGAKVRAAMAVPAAAQRSADCSSGAHTLSKAGDHVYPEMGNGGYTSLHTDVNLIYDTTQNLFLPGNNVVLTDKATQCLTDFSLDFERQSTDGATGPDLTVDSITVNGEPATFTFVQPTYPGDPNGQDDPDPLAHQSGQNTPASATNPNPPACSPTGTSSSLNGLPCPANKLVITPSAPIPAGAQFTVQVNYEGRPGTHTDGDGSTEGWFRVNTTAAPNDGSFTTTEPVGTMAWMPLNNHPSAKPTYDFNEQVTAGKTAISNGELTGFTANSPDANFPNGSTTWHWHSPEPIASYLVEASIGSYDLSERIASDGTLYYEAQASAITPTQKATNKAVMDQQEDITQFQARFNGPFPFSSDGVIVGIPSASFEEEMQTKITFAGGRISLGTFNHENMHQWWGDNVSEGNFNLTAFKEGFATLGEYYNSARTAATNAGGLDTPAGDAAFQTSLVNQFNSTYTGTRTSWSAAPSNPTPATLFSSSSTYTRAGVTYLALRQILGIDEFNRVMQQIQRDYGGGSITEPELEAEFHQGMPNQSQACSDRLDTFFTQWFDTAYPSNGVTKPQLTGPGLAANNTDGGTFYDTSGACQPGVPTTTADVAGDDVDGRYTDPTVTLTATPADGGSAIASTTYSVDGGADATYAAPFRLTGTGTHTIAFHSVDADGNVERAVTKTVVVNDPPVTAATVLPTATDGKVIAPATVVLTATDGDGVASTEYRIDGGAWTAYAGPITVTAIGAHTVDYRSTDRDGAVETAKSVTFTVVQPPQGGGDGGGGNGGGGNGGGGDTGGGGTPPAKVVCAKPKLTVAVSHPLRRSKGTVVLKKRHAYRFAGKLTCESNGRRVSAPRGTAVNEFDVVGGHSVRKPGTTVTRNGAISLLLKVPSSRTIAFTYAPVGAASATAKIKVKVVRK